MKMLYVALIALLIVVGVLFWQYRESTKKDIQIRELTYRINKKQVKVEFMLWELNEVYRTKDFKKATFLLGIIDTLEWFNGDRMDEQFTGWVLAKKNVNKKSKPLKMTEMKKEEK